MTETRILYLSPGLGPPRPDKSRFPHLSAVTSGDVLHPLWWRGPDDVRHHLGPEAYPVHRMGRFAFHWVFCPTDLGKVRQLWRRLVFYVREGRRILRDDPAMVVMTYGANLTGLAGVILKHLTGAKLIIEVPGVPHGDNLFLEANPSLGNRLRQKISELLFVFILRNADHAKLLYPTQLDAFPSLRDVPRSVFHNLVPSGFIEPGEEAEDRYILCMGHPWYRKGVDILIRAFRQVTEEFPGYTLKIVGWHPDKSVIGPLAEGCDRIEFIDPVPYDEAMDLMAHASLFVLPSRSEAMGRVQLEAMAAGRPIIGSAVDGIPHYLRDGFNGLLFEPGNPDDLAEKMRTMLGDRELAWKLADNAHANLHAELDEEAFVRRFDELLRAVVPSSASDDPTPSPASSR